MPFDSTKFIFEQKTLKSENAPKVLIVEDEKLLQISFQRLFTESGFEVTISNCGETALNEIRLHDFQLVITDIRLPRVDGFKVALSVKKKCRSTVVFITSTINDELIKEKAKQIGVDAFFEKPFEITEVCTRALQIMK